MLNQEKYINNYNIILTGDNVERYKYGRTYHFPWSNGVGSDDKIYHNWYNHFQYKDVVVTTKMDGENSCLYSDGYTHARSVDSANHESRDWLKKFWGDRCYNLPKGWRIYGENLYAKHSILYNDLPSYFMAFSIYDDNNVRLHWDDFELWCVELDVVGVPVLYSNNDQHIANPLDQTIVRRLYDQIVDDGGEGIVMTTVNGFHYDQMSQNLIKAVRKGHVQTDQHWMHKQCIPNKLKEN